MMSTDRICGAVRWFNPRKGYGFIDGENGEDVFVHYQNIDAHLSGYKELEEGETVEYQLVETANGLAATEVTRLSAHEEFHIPSLGEHEQNALHNLAKRIQPADIRKFASNDTEEHYMRSAVDKLKNLFNNLPSN